CKGVLISERGKVLAEASASYPLLFTPYGIEQSPADLWEGVRKVINEITQVANAEIRGVGVTSQGITFIPVDEQGNPLANAISWLDTRAEEELGEVLRILSEDEIFSLTGKRAEAYYLLPKLLWLRKNAKETYERAHKFLLVADFIVMKLTGETKTDHTLAGGTLLYDVVRNRWAERIMEEFGISQAKFPAICWAGELIGYVRESEETGLRKGTPIVIAGQDQKCASFAVGLREGIATISIGTASAITTITPFPLIDKKMRIPLFPYISPGKWVLEGVVSTAGACYDWWRKMVRKRLRQLPSPARFPHLPFFFPYLTGASSPAWKKEARGSFHNLSLSTTGEEMLFAIIEGVCFEIRKNIEVIEELVGEIKEFVAFGGGAKDRTWRMILTNVLGRRVFFPKIKDASAFGAAVLAGKSGGFFKELPKRQGEFLEPETELQKIFQERYSLAQREFNKFGS
ncbi:MAG: xylulokinase, partial [bacterium]